MRLIDLEPRWIEVDGRRIGFAFRSPVDPTWWQSCFAAKTMHRIQREAFETMFGGDDHRVQGCNTDCAWVIKGGIEAATFETMTVTPSLDGSRGGLWHGFITDGQIVGGLS